MSDHASATISRHCRRDAPSSREREQIRESKVANDLSHEI